LWSRTGRNWADAFPSITAAIKQLPVENVVLDGEAVCLREDGRPDFHALRSKHACKDARLVVYDLLSLDGEDLRRMPLQERRMRLASLLSGDPVLWFSSHVQGAQGAALFRHACALNLEGIVSKRIDTSYRSGPFLGWRKIKFPGYVRL
jgi:bifunctional non-homologous end joining protein LigD